LNPGLIISPSLVGGKENQFKLDPELAKLILAPILVDSINLQEHMKKVTPIDREAAHELISAILPQPSEAQIVEFQNQFFNTLQQVKFDTGSLSTDEMLRKDYKETVIEEKKLKIGMSSVTLNTAEWFERDSNLIQSLQKYCQDQQLNIHISMMMFDPVDPKRELMIFFPHESRKDLIEFLEGEKAGLHLKKLTINSDLPKDQVFCYKQGNLAISRKLLQPKLVEFFST